VKYRWIVVAPLALLFFVLSSCCELPSELSGNGGEDQVTASKDKPTRTRRRRARRTRRRGKRRTRRAATCEELCAMAPIDPLSGACVLNFVKGRGYEGKDEPECESPTSPSGCRKCAKAIKITDDDCRAVKAACL
jgi:hypothetical protein